MKLVIVDEARGDLARIADWIARRNPRRAVTFIDEIESHCQRISLAPFAHPLLPGHEDGGLRRAVHGNYLIFYRVDPGQVVVIHVLHGARDYEPILFPES
jgi:plasmid stabilization system protein ParE